MTNVDPPPSQQTIGGFDRSGRLWVLALFGFGGAAIGALLPLLAAWVAELPWAPFQGPLELLGSFNEPWLVWGRPVVGLVLGLSLAAWVIVESPALSIRQDEVQVRRRGQVERVIPRSKVDSVYLRKSHVVIETASGRNLFDDEIEGDKAAVRDAFVSQGYPWEGFRD